MITRQPYGKICGHPSHRGDRGVDDCGRVRYEARPNREDRHRTWIVSVEFFEKNRWMPSVEIEVKAQGVGGAVMKAVKHERASKRRVLQTRIVAVPVARAGIGRPNTNQSAGVVA
jgi:hypothetical protein